MPDLSDSRFRIIWSLPEGNWAKVKVARERNPPGSWLDLTHEVVRLFNGEVGISFGDQELIHVPPSEYDDGPPVVRHRTKLSVADLAERLAILLGAEEFVSAPAGVEARYWDPGHLTLWFKKLGGVVRIESSGLYDPILEVPLDAFEAGARSFVNDFVAEAEARVPGFADWNTLAGLRPGEAGIAGGHWKLSNAWRQRPPSPPPVPSEQRLLERWAVDTDDILVEWWIDPERWTEVQALRERDPPGSFFDVEEAALHQPLSGYLQVGRGGVVLFPSAELVAAAAAHYSELEQEGMVPSQPRDLPARQWIVVPLPFVVRQVLAMRGDAPSPLNESRRRFLSKAPDEAAVRVAVNLRNELGEAADDPRVLDGLGQFARTFAATIGERAPACLEWESFAALRAAAGGTPPG